MKRSIWLCIVVRAVAAAAPAVVFDDTFDRGHVGSVPKGWQFRAPEGTSVALVDAQPLAGSGKAIEVVDRTAQATAQARCSFPTVWVGEATFRIRTAQTNQYFVLGVSSSRTGAGAYTWGYRGGDFKYNAGQGDTAYPVPLKYRANEWMDVSLRWNAFEHTIGLSLDGKSLGDGIAYPRVGAVDTIYFSSAGSRDRSQPRFWVDRVTVTRLAYGLPQGLLVLQPSPEAVAGHELLWPHASKQVQVDMLSFRDLPDLVLAAEAIPPDAGVRAFVEPIGRPEAKRAERCPLPTEAHDRVSVNLGWACGERVTKAVTITLAAQFQGQTHTLLSLRGEPMRLRPIHPETPLVLQGKAQAAIVPATLPELAGLAEAVQSRIQDATGCALPIVQAHALPRDPAGRPHCIAIGNLESNPLLARLYEQRYVRCDRGFPGKAGYVVRTVHDPWGTGRNVIVLAGSDPDGVRSAVAKFLARIKPGRDLVLDRLMDIKLAPYVRKRIARVNNSSMGRNAWQYYLTGDEAFARRFREKYVRQTRGTDGVFDDAETSGLVTVQPHLFIYSAYRGWALIEDSPVFSATDRQRITRYFLDMVQSREGLLQGGYRGDLRRPRPRQNHQTRTAMGVYYMADYAAKYGRLPEAQDWLAKSTKFFRAHDTDSKPACDSNGHQWGASWADVLRYALISGRHTPFLTGAARQGADRSTANTNPLGALVFTGDMSALGGPAPSVHMATAYFYREGKYGFRQGGFSSFHILPSYADGLRTLPPTDHVGIYRAKLAPLYYRTPLRGSQTGVPLHRAYDKLSFRSDFSRDAHYLLLDGIAGGSHSYDDVNSILELWHRGRALLVTGESLYGHSMKHHNALVVVRDGEGGPTPRVAELIGAWELDSVGFASSKVSDYCGVDWTRHILWRKDEYVLVLDEVEARRDGDYSLQWYWRTLGEPRLSGSRFQVEQHPSHRLAPPRGAQVVKPAGLASFAASSGKTCRDMKELGAFLYRSDSAGDFFEIETTIAKASKYHLELGCLGYSDRGTVQVSVDGRKVGPPVKLHRSTALSFTASLGPLELAQGKHRVRFTVASAAHGVGKAFIGLHYLAFVPHREGYKPRRAEQRNDVVTIQSALPVACSFTSNERMGKLWSRYRYAEPVLRVLRQAIARPMSQGDRVVHGNLISISTQSHPSEWTVHDRGQGLLCIRDAHAGSQTPTLAGIASVDGKRGLFMIGPWGAAATDGGLLPKELRVQAPEGTAVEINFPNSRVTFLAPAAGRAGVPLGKSPLVNGLAVKPGPLTETFLGRPTHSVALPPGRSIVRQDDMVAAAELPRAIDRMVAAATPSTTDRAASKPAAKAPIFDKIWQTRAGGAILALHVDDIDNDGSKEIIVGCADGKALVVDATGRTRWSYTTGDAVHAVSTANLDGAGHREVLVGSDDAFLYALDSAGRELWKHSPPFGHQPWVYWTLYSSKVRAIAPGDLDGDGRDDVVLGCGNMRCVGVSSAGKQMWEFRTDHGTCTTLQVADVDMDGHPEVVGAKGIFSSNSNGFRLRGDGSFTGAYANQGWTSVAHALVITDLENDGRPEVIFGTDRGENLRVFDGQSRQLRWAKPLGDDCTCIAAVDLDGDGCKEVVAGSASLYVSAYTSQGRGLWHRTVSDSVVALAAGDLSTPDGPEIAVGSMDGAVTLLDAQGQPLGIEAHTSPVTQLAIARLSRAGAATVLVGRRDGTVTALKARSESRL